MPLSNPWTLSTAVLIEILFACSCQIASVSPTNWTAEGGANHTLAGLFGSSQTDKGVPQTTVAPTQSTTSSAIIHEHPSSSSLADGARVNGSGGFSQNSSAVSVFKLDMERDCDNNGTMMIHTFWITGTEGVFMISNHSRPISPRDTTACGLRIHGPPEVSSLSVTFQPGTSVPCDSGYLLANECVMTVGDSLFWYFCGQSPPVLYTSTNCLSLVVGIYEEKMIPGIVMNVSSEFAAPELETVFITPKSGFVSSPRFDGVSPMSPNVRCDVTLTVQDDEVIMISFLHFDLSYDNNGCLSFYEIVNSTVGSECFNQCGTDVLRPKIYPSSLLVKFTSAWKPGMAGTIVTGFKMQFSMHPKHNQPVRLENGKFICSGVNFESFKQHLLCNLEIECEGGEDEANCSYTSPWCKHDITIGEKCYSYTTLAEKVSWTEAYTMCRSTQSDLVSFNTAEEEASVLWVLQQWRKWSHLAIGLQTTDRLLPRMYKETLQWVDGTIAFDMSLSDTAKYPSCAEVMVGMNITKQLVNCNEVYDTHLLCEYVPSKKKIKRESGLLQFPTLLKFRPSNLWSNISIVECPGGHVTLDFLSCDPTSQCKDDHFLSTCKTSAGGEMPMFVCDDDLRTIAFTLTCNFRPDCVDGSDEDFCVYPECSGYTCQNGNCIELDELCDDQNNCVDGSDERRCLMSGWFRSHYSAIERKLGPLLITINGVEHVSVSSLNSSKSCPETHFACPESHCLPVHFRCNGVSDCPYGEDEVDCNSYTCPGFYRCRASHICVHADQMCDGVFHCPQQDDEKFCTLSCPGQCRCQGLAFVCPSRFSTDLFSEIRFLDASSSGMTPADLTSRVYLIRLHMSYCGIYSLPSANVTFPNLRHLDLSHNLIQSVCMDTFTAFPNLRTLDLSWNSITHIGPATDHFRHSILRQVHLSGLQLSTFTAEPFSCFVNIENLNVSNGQFHEVESFERLLNLIMIDMSGTAIETFPNDVFQGLEHLEEVRVDNYKLCCEDILPEKIHPENCIAPQNELSSCENLLRSDLYRACLWVFAAIATVGNALSISSKLCAQKEGWKTGFHVFVLSLSMSDLLMGVYLGMIGVADHVYRGSYLWNEQAWRRSWTCQTAGFLSLVSSEVSAFIICLITLDRFIVLRFPFSQRHFQAGSAAVACGVAWLLGAVLAAVPLLPVTSHWEFYSQTGICIPLPITNTDFAGQGYSLGIMIVLNFVLFLLIAVGQVSIYCSIRANSMTTSDSSRKSREHTIARRLAAIVISDFLCWFPIGFLGLMAAQGVSIPSEVNVGIAIFVLPLNSALNPFLYTLNALMERKKEQQQKKLMKNLEARIKSGTLQLTEV